MAFKLSHYTNDKKADQIMKKSKPSNFAPVFIASTAVFFLGSAFKFIFGHKKEESTHSQHIESIPEIHNDIEEVEDSENAQEPEEDPVQSL